MTPDRNAAYVARLKARILATNCPICQTPEAKRDAARFESDRLAERRQTGLPRCRSCEGRGTCSVNAFSTHVLMRSGSRALHRYLRGQQPVPPALRRMLDREAKLGIDKSVNGANVAVTANPNQPDQ